MGMKEFWGGDGNVLKWIVVLIMQLYKFTKNY